MLKNVFKKLFSTICTVSFLACSCFALPPEIEKIRDQFWKDSLHFQYDEKFVIEKWREIIDSYNSETGKSATAINEIPRSYLIPRILPLHDSKKMICSTQCIYYSNLFTEAKIENYIIHIAQYTTVSGKTTLTNFHDNLIYFNPEEKCWKMIDFTSAVEELNMARTMLRFMGIMTLDDGFKSKFIGKYFEKNLKDKLVESRDHWLAVGYYDGDSIKDLRGLASQMSGSQYDSRKICGILDRQKYMRVGTYCGRPVLK